MTPGLAVVDGLVAGLLRRPAPWLALALAALCGCESAKPAAPRTRALPPGVVARVGDLDVSSDTVVAIASEQGLSLEQARDHAVYDALLATGARADLSPRVVADGEARVLARALLRTVWAEAQGAPITDAELTAAIERNWSELDRPVGYRTVHAHVSADDKASAEYHRVAQTLAERLRAAVQPASDQAKAEPGPVRSEEDQFDLGAGPADPAAEAFIAAAKAITKVGYPIRAEQLHPVTQDGKPIQKGTLRGAAAYDPDFTAAATSLRARGELSEVIRSSFGYHVIMLLEITPEKRASKDECLAATRDEILRLRAGKTRDEILARMTEQLGVEVATNAEALMTRVPVVEQTEVAEAAKP